jgi:hypothetical protein
MYSTKYAQRLGGKLVGNKIRRASRAEKGDLSLIFKFYWYKIFRRKS